MIKALIQLYFNFAFKGGLIIVLLSTFFLFTPITTEYFDTPKFLILILFVGIMLIFLGVKFTVQNHVKFTRTPFDLPLILLLAVAVVSTLLSSSPYVALLGQGAKVHGSLTSLALYVLFFFILTQGLKGKQEIRWILNLCVLTAAALSLLTLLAYFGVKLPFPQASASFTPTGSSFSTTAILALLLPLLVAPLLNSKNLIFLSVNSAILLVFGVTIALTGNLSTWIASLFGLLITFYAFNPIKGVSFKTIKDITSHFHLFIPLAAVSLVLVITILSLLPPLGGVQNPLYSASRNFPRELQLSFPLSWKVSDSAFRDSPFYGSGPSTYLFNFTTYKPLEFNSTKFWNIRFDSAFNEYLHILGTLGSIGLLAFLSLTAIFVSRAIPAVKLKDPLNVALGTSGLVFFVTLALHPSTLPLMIVGLLSLSCFWAVSQKETPQNLPWLGKNIKQTFLKIANITHSSEETIKVEALPSVILVASTVIVGFTLFFASKFFIADMHHRNAIEAVSKNQGIVAYNELVAAEKLNPYSDLYRTGVAQVNLALANAIASAKGPTEASPGGSLTDQDKQNIQVLLQQAITEGRTATTLSPRSAANWEILALLYRQIAGVAQNALLFSLDSYGRAIFNDPLNPILRLNVGGVYYAVQNYDLAIRFFTDAINLKPDFANGYYNLSVALRDKGNLNAALQAAEKVVQLVQVDSPDYKVATDYLTDLKDKVSPPAPEQPPAAETQGALQEEKLPKVLELPKPEKIATPEAIKASPSPKP